MLLEFRQEGDRRPGKRTDYYFIMEHGLPALLIALLKMRLIFLKRKGVNESSAAPKYSRMKNCLKGLFC